MRDEVLRVDFIPETVEERFFGSRFTAPQPKGAVLLVRFKGEARTVRVSRARGEQALAELLVAA